MRLIRRSTPKFKIEYKFTPLKFEVLSFSTSWISICEICNKSLRKSVESEISSSDWQPPEHINTCRDCFCSKLIYAAQDLDPQDNLSPADLKNYILDKCKGV